MKYAVVMAVMAMTVGAFAQGPRMPMMNGSFEPLVKLASNPKMAEKIGLTADQTAKLKALSDSQKEMKPLQEKVREAMKRQSELMQAEKIDEAAVMAAVDEVWAARKEVAKAQTKRVIAVRAILTPEQMKAAREAMAEMRPRGARKPPVKSPKAAEKTAAPAKPASAN